MAPFQFLCPVFIQMNPSDWCKTSNSCSVCCLFRFLFTIENLWLAVVNWYFLAAPERVLWINPIRGVLIKKTQMKRNVPMIHRCILKYEGCHDLWRYRRYSMIRIFQQTDFFSSFYCRLFVIQRKISLKKSIIRPLTAAKWRYLFHLACNK